MCLSRVAIWDGVSVLHSPALLSVNMPWISKHMSNVQCTSCAWSHGVLELCQCHPLLWYKLNAGLHALKSMQQACWAFCQCQMCCKKPCSTFELECCAASSQFPFHLVSIANVNACCTQVVGDPDAVSTEILMRCRTIIFRGSCNMSVMIEKFAKVSHWHWFHIESLSCMHSAELATCAQKAHKHGAFFAFQDVANHQMREARDPLQGSSPVHVCRLRTLCIKTGNDVTMTSTRCHSPARRVPIDTLIYCLKMEAQPLMLCPLCMKPVNIVIMTSIRCHSPACGVPIDTSIYRPKTEAQPLMLCHLPCSGLTIEEDWQQMILGSAFFLHIGLEIWEKHTRSRFYT